MNYFTLDLPELNKLLHERKINNPALNNELAKLYGVTWMPSQQSKARDEAIRRLEEYDKQKWGVSRIGKLAAAVIGILAAMTAIIAFFRSIL